MEYRTLEEATAAVLSSGCAVVVTRVYRAVTFDEADRLLNSGYTVALRHGGGEISSPVEVNDRSLFLILPEDRTV